ncbi:MAG: hypothetical protein JNK67_32315 [Alphaproteobacteria bacterium]|nr:hypothetical protein [Alphaproteobacteria bacterium]
MARRRHRTGSAARRSQSTPARSRLTRRRVLVGGSAGAAAVAAALSGPSPAEAQARAITTLILENAGKDSLPAQFVTRAIGHAFRKGDVPAGSYPRFELEDGTECPMSWWGRATYDDGSWRFAGFVLRVPRALPAGGKLPLRVKATTRKPATATRGLADIGRRNFQIEAVGRKNITGTWIASVNQGIRDGADVVDLGDPAADNGGGPVAKVFRIGQGFVRDGAVHDSIYAWFYVFVLQDDKGGLYGMRILPGYAMPWLQSGDAAFKAFDDVVLKDGKEKIAEVPLIERSFEFSHSSGPSFTKTGQVSLGCVFRPESTGRLPDGLSANDAYTMRVYYRPDQAWVNSTSLIQAGHPDRPGYIKPAGGSGRHSARVLPFVGRGMISFLCQPNAEYGFIAAGGTGRDPEVIPLHDRAYLRSTCLIPALPLEPPKQKMEIELTYHWGYSTGAGIYYGEIDTGGRNTIGPVHRLHAEHFAFQSARDWQNCMVMGLQAGWRPVLKMDRETRSMMRVREGDYPGMGRISMVGFRIYDGAPLPKDVDPDFNRNWGAKVSDGWLVVPDTAHVNCLLPYSYLISARPEMSDLLAATAIDRIASQPTHHRDFDYRGRRYGGVFALMDGQSRDTAWAIRDVMAAAALLGDAATCKRHIADCMDDTIDFMVASRATANPLFDRIGLPWHYSVEDKQFWTPNPNTMFALLYHVNMLVWLSQVFPGEKTDAIRAQVAKFAGYFWRRGQLYSMSSFPSVWKVGPNARTFPTDEAQIGEPFTCRNASWNGGTGRIVMPGTNGGAPSIGKLAGFAAGDRIVLHAGKIGGVELWRPYHLRDVDGEGFGLSETAGGAPIAIAGSGSGAVTFTGLFSRGLLPKQYREGPTLLQIESLCRVIRALHGPAVIPDKLLADVEAWMQVAALGPAVDQNSQFRAEQW